MMNWKVCVVLVIVRVRQAAFSQMENLGILDGKCLPSKELQPDGECGICCLPRDRTNTHWFLLALNRLPGGCCHSAEYSAQLGGAGIGEILSFAKNSVLIFIVIVVLSFF